MVFKKPFFSATAKKEENDCCPKKSQNIWRVVVASVLAVAILLIVWLISVLVLNGKSLFNKNQKGAANQSWSAVFLANDQVYFGKIKNVAERDLTLTNIYYLQVVNTPLQRTQEGGDTASNTQQELKLVKLGNEIHGPKDQMIINRDQVLLIEELKDDSRVVQAIKEYLAPKK